MEAGFDFIENMNINQRWRQLRVHVVRIWRQQNYNKAIWNSLEMVIVDQKVYSSLDYAAFFAICK